MLPLSKYTFYNCHLSPAVNDPAIKWKQCMMMVRLVMMRLMMAQCVNPASSLYRFRSS